MDEFNRAKLEEIVAKIYVIGSEIVDDYQQKIPPILDEELVYIIDDDQDAKATAHPYVNMALGQAGEEQMLVIAGEGFPSNTAKYTIDTKLDVGINFGNHFRFTNRLATFVDNDNRHRFWSPTFRRRMVLTTYAGYGKAGEYGLMFSQIDTTQPLSRPSGPQAELIRHGDQRRLFVIDARTAQRLYWQCTNWFYDWSLTYQLVRAAHGVLSMTTALNIFYYMNDVQQQYIDELRDQIYIYGELVSQRLEKAMYVEKIYKVAIVRQYSMPTLAAHLVQKQPLVLDPPDYGILVEPFNNNINQAIHDWQLLYELISSHQLYHRPWAKIFGQSGDFHCIYGHPCKRWCDHSYSSTIR
ncbi:uncharacterized protein LOC128954198 [Oppia nitens]|uniref:uncharacterized protein LOC128954198 n=1 Tax=Oppia nitens TaxID=1686743 RepID=UPI0023DA98FB|nr:uncharacterized protein LOC128954198 [Oppia nitens]